MASGATREIAPGWDRSADGIALNRDGTKIYTTAYDVGTHDLFAVDVASGDVAMVVEGGTVGDGGEAIGPQPFCPRVLDASPERLVLEDVQGVLDIRVDPYLVVGAGPSGKNRA